eukprot:PhM_4_TR2798/c0_g1_i1/m.22134/K04714/SGMS; shingomyelin synthase
MQKSSTLLPVSAAAEERDATLRDAVSAVGSLIFIFIFHVWEMTIVTARTPDPRVVPPLRDIVFDTFPVKPEGLSKYTEVVLFVQNFACLYMAIVELRTMQMRYRCVTRFFLTWSVCVLWRTLCFSVTSLPATDNHCQHHESYEMEDVYENMFTLFTSTGSKGTHCGDLLYSGHTLSIILSFMTIFTYSKSKLLKGMCLVLTPLSWYTILVSRSHYSIDVLVSVLLTSFTWRVTPELFPALDRNFFSFLAPWK